MTKKIITCIGDSYIDPILTLYEELDKNTSNYINEINSSYIVNGYSVSIVILSVLMIDSILNRIRYLKNDQSKIKNLDFFKSEFNNKKLSEKLTEIYVLRDIIAHNHIFEIEYDYDQNHNFIIKNTSLLKTYGDKKYSDNIDKTHLCTKILKLNINPIKIDKSDVLKVFNVLKELFEFLEHKDIRYFPLSHWHFYYKNKWLNFYQIIDNISGKP